MAEEVDEGVVFVEKLVVELALLSVTIKVCRLELDGITLICLDIDYDIFFRML